MQPRSTLIAQFSGFALFENDAFRGWVSESRLHRSMQVQLQAQNIEHERFWVLYWYRVWVRAQALESAPDDRAEAHLAAYLQEACYWTAIALQQKAARAGSTPPHSLSDYFQMAAGYLRAVLQKFDDTAFNNNVVLYRAKALGAGLKGAVLMIGLKSATHPAGWDDDHSVTEHFVI